MISENHYSRPVSSGCGFGTTIAVLGNMSQLTSTSKEALDREVARLKSARVRRVALVLTGMVALATVLVALSYLSLTDMSTLDENGAPPITANNTAYLVE